MIPRRLQNTIEQALARSPAVALLGPRQVGKTTLALDVAKSRAAVYLDLESETDLAKLTNAELYLQERQDKLVILDEVHRSPGLFPLLRGLIDRGRREGRRTGLYLLLGSASLDLLQQSGETLAGRIAFMELRPVDALEFAPGRIDTLWQRGGFPDSLLAPDDAESLRWRRDFIRTYLERDIPQFGPRIAADTLRRFWTMLAHQQGGLLNSAELARGLGIDTRTVSGYLALLTDLLLVRQLEPWHASIGKRLVKSRKTYIRDSGLLHALLHIADTDALLGHPVAGSSWEGFVMENLLAAAPDHLQAHFYRTAAGAEIDLLLTWPDGGHWAVEIKRSANPKPERGFHNACEDLQPRRSFVVYPGNERFNLSTTIEAIPLPDLMREVLNA
jgi:uncharacterized protein